MSGPAFEALASLFAAVLVNGKTGEIAELNTSFTLLTGWTQKDLRGKQLDAVIPERSRAVHHDHQAVYMESPTPRPMGKDRQVFLLCKDDSELLVWIGLSPIENDLVVAAILPIEGAALADTLNPQTTH